MAKIQQYSTVNPEKFTPTEYNLPPRYHIKQFDRATFEEMQDKRHYRVRKQLDDVNCNQVTTDALGVRFQILDCKGLLLEEFSPSQQVTLSGSTSGTTYQFKFKLSDFPLPRGFYFYAIEYEYADGFIYHISEPIWAKADHPRTLLIEYSHNKNDFYTAFVLNPRFATRVPGILLPETDVDEDTQFTDQQQATKTLDSKVTQRLYMELKSIPQYLASRVNQAFRCSAVSVEGIRINKDNGAEWETGSGVSAWVKTFAIRLQYYDPRITHTFVNQSVVLLDYSTLPLYISNLSIYDQTSGQPIILSTDKVIDDAGDVTALLATWNGYVADFDLQGTFSSVGSTIVYNNGGTEDFILSSNVVFTGEYLIELASANDDFEFGYKSTGFIAVVWSGSTGSTLQPSPSTLVLVDHNYGGTGVQTVRIFHNQTLTNITIQGATGLKRVTDLPSDAPTGLLNFMLTNADSSYTSFDMTTLVPAAGLLTFTLGNSSFTSITFPYATAPSPGNPHMPGLRTIAIGGNALDTSDVQTFLFNIVNYLNFSPGSGFFNSAGQTPAAPVLTSYGPRVVLANSGWFIITD